MTKSKKKSTPGDAPIPMQDYGTTSGSKTQWLADILFDLIEDDTLMGKPLKRPANRSVDRVFRKKVEKANMEGDCIINIGDGYFRPDRHDEADVYAYRLYRAKELKRAQSIIEKINSMDKAFYGGTNNGNV